MRCNRLETTVRRSLSSATTAGTAPPGAPTPEVVARLVEAGVVVGATAPDAGPEVLEFPDHPFYVTSMFQPHIGAMEGRPVHPLVRAFTDAVRSAP